MPEVPQPPTHPKHVRLGLYLFAFALSAAGFYLVLQDKAASAGVLLGAAGFAILLANLDKIEYIKGFGFEAKMRTLDEKMAEAHEIVDQLRTLAVSTARHIITLVSSGDGYVEKYSRKTAWEMIENVRQSLVDLGIAQSKIDEVLAPYHRKILNHFDHSLRHFASNSAAQLVEMNLASNDVSLLADELRTSSEIGTNPAGWRRLAGMVAKINRSAPHHNSGNLQEMIELANDLEHWQTMRQLRRPEAYFN